MKNILLVLCLTVVTGCASKAPPNLEPGALKIWQANEAVVAIGTLQHAAIELNGVQICEPAPCRPLLSDANTRVVVDAVTDALTTMKAIPAGWRATALSGLERVEMRLDEAGKTKLASYVAAARSIINALIGG